MRASRTLISYHASFLKTLMVIQSNQTKADVDSNKQEQEHRSTQLAIALLLSWWSFFHVLWIVWVVHESIAYSHWLPYQPSQDDDCCCIVWSAWLVHESIMYSHLLPGQPSQDVLQLSQIL